MVLEVLTGQNDGRGELNALASVLIEFDSEADNRKLDYLKHRYAGFTRKESAVLAGVTLATSNRWLKDDARVAKFDTMTTTEDRKALRKDVLQEEWGRNFYLVMRKDNYILRKANGLLEETIYSINTAGVRTKRMGCPMMTKDDWDYYGKMRKAYSPEAWNAVEKAVSGQGTTFNIAEFILNQGNTQQVNIASA